MSKNLFNSVELKRPNRNRFDLSHDVKMSLRMGLLYPTLGMACVPGDKINLGCESLLRFMPMVTPVMHRMNCWMHYFFVPARLLWDNWENWITNTKVSGNVPAHPYLSMNGTRYTPLWDYLGIPDPDDPSTGGNAVNISPMMAAAYNKIYNDYYRDENLINSGVEIPYKLADGDNNAMATDFILRRRAWEKDYFTGSLPFAQKGDAVGIPIGDVVANRLSFDHSDPPTMYQSDGSHIADDGLRLFDSTGGAAKQAIHGDSSGSEASELMYDPKGTLEVDATTINDLRRAFRLQEWLERNALGGTRYTESNWAHFGVKSSDKRLQRAEYIVGTKSPVSISEVLNTSGDSLPQGNMSGHGISVTSGQKYGHYFCEEHGYIIGVMSVMPRTAYQQGIPKEFLKINDFSEIFWPSFAHIGEQPIDIEEIFAFNNGGPIAPFGYTPRYAEYKYMPSRVAGEMRTTLKDWTLARIFDSQPALNANFIECVPSNRIFAVTEDIDNLVAHIYHKISANRMMPFYGSPKF